MKKIKNTNIILAIACFLFTNIAFGQTDIILKTNGEEMKGKVLKMGENTIDFVYVNETIEYTVKKSDIVKITFSSGRVEFFNKINTKSNNYNLEDHHNKVAILPFGYLKDQQTSNAIMQKKIQQETYSLFKRRAAALKFQDPLNTNALLAKAGINNNNIAGYTMGEIANILGVEYLVQGMVSIQKTTVTSYTNTNTTTKRNSNNNVRVDRHGNIIGDIWNTNKRKTNSSTFGTSQQNYATNITMNIYNDKGENIFTKDHQSFWQTQDAYKITLSFLAKRTPIYKR